MMDELIYRQDAIRWVKTNCNPYGKPTLDYDSGIKVINHLEKMTSVDAVEVVRCKDCKHRVVNENYGDRGYLSIKAMCELDTGDPFEFGRDAEDDNWFCKDGERKTDG